jgi:hypothetical protein
VHTIDLPDMPEPGGAPPEKSVHPPQDQANLLGIITDVGATDNGGRERCVIPAPLCCQLAVPRGCLFALFRSPGPGCSVVVAGPGSG